MSKYFDTIPHSDLLKSVARRIVDWHVLWLIKLWLKAPVEERDSDGTRRVSGGKSSTCGTPQGGVVSPLLANIYMNRFLKHGVFPDAAKHSMHTSSLTPTTSSLSAVDMRKRLWRGRRR